MKQRNGAGSKRLVEATERFIRSEQKLLEVLGSRRILKKSECDHFAKDLSLSAAKKRSSDVFSSAISINRKLMGILSKSKAGAVKQTTDADVMPNDASSCGGFTITGKVRSPAQSTAPRYKVANSGVWIP
jgi:hypothetical protein